MDQPSGNTTYEIKLAEGIYFTDYRKKGENKLKLDGLFKTK